MAAHLSRVFLIDRALLRVGDLPGVIASGRLRVNNSGSRFTGEGRLIADATLNGPFRIGVRTGYCEGSPVGEMVTAVGATRRSCT